MEPFQQLIFSGGGIRCFWYGGFLEATREPLGLAPQRIAGVSGGALSASCFIAKVGRRLLDNMASAFEDVNHNIDLQGDEPGDGLTPHQRVYREVVEQTIDDSACAAIASGPQFQVLLAHPPFKRFPKLSTFPLMVAYALDLKMRSTPYLRFTKWMGLSSELVDARKGAAEGKLTDLICNAAVIPPVFNLQGWHGKKVVDGGLACKAPFPIPDKGRTLILLTRRFRNLPQHPRLVYAQVSDETPADKLDFTDRDKLKKTWEMGRSDGERFVSSRKG